MSQKREKEHCCAVRVVRVQMQVLKRRPASVCDSLLSRTASERAKKTRTLWRRPELASDSHCGFCLISCGCCSEAVVVVVLLHVNRR